jgi:hypothetical protein
MADITRPRYLRADGNPAILFKCLWKNQVLIKWVCKIEATNVGTYQCLLRRNSIVWNVSFSDGRDVMGERPLFGHCCRWRPEETATGKQPSAVIGAEIIQNGCFLETRLPALDMLLSLANVRNPASNLAGLSLLINPQRTPITIAEALPWSM